MKYILSIDQGTTSSRAILYDLNFNEVSSHQLEHEQFYPHEGWVEHDADEIIQNVITCCKKAIDKANIQAKEILSIGITNQRETIVAWDKTSSKPIYRAIVWQDKRTAEACEKDKKVLHSETIKQKTGLTIDPYFSASKMRWIIENIPESKSLTDSLCIGTIDSWIVWNLTKGKNFLTDVSNASRTNIFNITSLKWDQNLLKHYNIPQNVLPEVKNSIGELAICDSSHFGYEIPINSIAGDQQASLYGNGCIHQSSIKNTIGTGSFLLQNKGNQVPSPKNGLLTTIAWKEGNQTTYATEGSIFNTGSAIRWLRDQIKLISNYDEIEEICNNITENEVMLVPAFSGLGTPHWDMNARGTILGLTLDSDKNKIVKATIDSIAYQTRDIIEAMKDDAIEYISIDGGGSQSNYILQKISDICQIEVRRAKYTESTAVGVAMMAAKAHGINLDEIKHHVSFTPKINEKQANKEYQNWKRAVKRSLNWIEK